MVNDQGAQKYKFKSLGIDSRDFGYDHAKRAAEAWFNDREAGVTDEPLTVEDLCRLYIADMRADKRDAAAYQAEIRFKREVYGKPLGSTLLTKVRKVHLKKWRNGIAGANATQNRSFRGLKAVLNFGVSNRHINAARAVEWSSIEQHENADGRRLLFLDLQNRRDLIEAAVGSTRDLLALTAACGGRPGEIVKLRVKDYDAKTKTVTFAAKALVRTVPISDEAAAVFDRLCEGKKPNDGLVLQADGTPYRHSTVWAEEIREAAALAELPAGVCLYSMRHAWITEALLTGMATLTVARLTGTSLAMIEKHYGHLVTDMARKQLSGLSML